MTHGAQNPASTVTNETDSERGTSEHRHGRKQNTTVMTTTTTSISSASAGSKRNRPAESDDGRGGEDDDHDDDDRGDASPRDATSEPLQKRCTAEAISAARERMERVEAAERRSVARLEEARRALDEARRSFEAARIERDGAALTTRRMGEEVCDLLLQEEGCFWNDKYGELIEYKRKHGHTNVTRGFHSKICREDDQIRKLGTWVGLQRKNYRKDPREIRSDRICLLNKIGFDWDPIKSQWLSHFEDMKKFKEKFGHTRVPDSYEKKDLWNWTRDQRVQYRNLKESQAAEGPSSEASRTGAPAPAAAARPGKRTILSEERHRLLLSINFEWDIYERYFDEGFDLLMAYKRLHMGDTNVPKDFPTNPPLAKWVQEVRKHYCSYEGGSRSKNCLNEERIQRLEGAGFYWTDRDAQWAKRWRDLGEYMRLNGGSVRGLSRDNPALQVWVTKQRSEYWKLAKTGKSSMTEWRIRNLEKLDGFDWEGNYIAVAKK